PIWAERVLDDPLEAAYHYSLAGELLPGVETLTAQLQTLLNRGQALAAAQEVDRMLARARRPAGEHAARGRGRGQLWRGAGAGHRAGGAGRSRRAAGPKPAAAQPG